MKAFFLLLISVISLSAHAQRITKVSLQASGLTCSMCNKSIYKALTTLDFIDHVDANVETATFDITFKPGAPVDFDRLKRKVEDAGFFVSRFVATASFENLAVNNNIRVQVGDQLLHFVGLKSQTLSGTVRLRVLNKGYVSSKEYKKNPVAASAQQKEYYVSIS